MELKTFEIFEIFLTTADGEKTSERITSNMLILVSVVRGKRKLRVKEAKRVIAGS